MDLGDLIFPLLIIGSVIVQWLGSRNKGEKGVNDAPQQQSHSTSRETETGEASWDDLMEALGQPTAPPEIPAIPAQKAATPPPVPAYQTPATPDHVSLLDRQQRQLAAKQEELLEIQRKTKVKLPSRSQGPASVRYKARPSSGFRNVLNNRHSLRQAIVLNEILQPPVSLR